MEENCHVEPIHKTATADQVMKAERALLTIWGMGCPNCATRVRNSLLALDGVYAADVYLNMGVAEVRFDKQKISAPLLVEAVSRAGNDVGHEYRAELMTA